MTDTKDHGRREVTPEQHARVSKYFVNRLWNVFGEPKTNDLESFIDEYVRALSRYGVDALNEGADELFANLKREFRVSHWPTIKECIDACNTASRAIHARNNPAPKLTRDYAAEDKRSYDERRAAEMIRGSVAERACRDGWIVGLHDFVRDNNRLPHGDEERALISSAAFVRECAAGSVNMGALHQGLHTLATAMLVRRAKLEDEFRAGF
jgi:hypothetical protein